MKTCETDVEKVCKNNITETENTTLQDCLANAKLFKKQFALCFVMKPTEACTCLESVDTDNVEKLKQCDTSDTSNEVVAKKKMCVKGMNLHLWGPIVNNSSRFFEMQKRSG